MLNKCSFLGINLSVFLTLGFSPTLSQLPTIRPAPPDLPAEIANPIYILGSGDEITIAVFEYDEFAGPRTILPDGTISLPLIGRVMAANRTSDQLARELTIRLESLLVNPVVNVSLTKQRPLRVNVAGEVLRPGPMQLNSYNNANTFGGSSPQLPTVSAALLQAGGVTKDADIRGIVLRRSRPFGNSPGIRINLWEALFSENVPRDIILQDGDSIFVPKLEIVESIDSRLLTQSSIAPKTVRVRVVGEVKKPGELEVPPNSSISSAVAIAGGPTDKAKLSKVTFVRLREDGRVEERLVDISNLTDTFQIQDGDVIIVPKSNTATALDFTNQAVAPFSFLLQLINLFK